MEWSLNFFLSCMNIYIYIRDGAEPEYGIRKGTNNVVFTNTYFKQILEKIFVFGNKKTVISKSCVFSWDRSTCPDEWVSDVQSGEGKIIKAVTDTGCSTHLHSPHSNSSAEWKNCVTILFNRFLYLNWVPKAIYNFQEAEFDRDIISLRCNRVNQP